MSFRLWRFRLRTLLAAVVLVALALGGGVWAERLLQIRAHCLARAAWHAERATNDANHVAYYTLMSRTRKSLPGEPPETAERARECLQQFAKVFTRRVLHHSTLEKKFQYAADHPGPGHRSIGPSAGMTRGTSVTRAIGGRVVSVPEAVGRVQQDVPGDASARLSEERRRPSLVVGELVRWIAFTGVTKANDRTDDRQEREERQRQQHDVTKRQLRAEKAGEERHRQREYPDDDRGNAAKSGAPAGVGPFEHRCSQDVRLGPIAVRAEQRALESSFAVLDVSASL